MNQNPEQSARDRIDQLLKWAGWTVQGKRKIDLNAALGGGGAGILDGGRIMYCLWTKSQWASLSPNAKRWGSGSLSI
jgi:hypothetical protein